MKIATSIQNRFEASFLKIDNAVMDAVLSKKGVSALMKGGMYRLLKAVALSEDRPTAVRDHAFKLLGYFHDKSGGVPASDVERLNNAANRLEETKSPWQALEGVYHFRKALQLLVTPKHGMGLRLPVAESRL